MIGPSQDERLDRLMKLCQVSLREVTYAAAKFQSKAGMWKGPAPAVQGSRRAASAQQKRPQVDAVAHTLAAQAPEEAAFGPDSFAAMPALEQRTVGR